ncbi:MAG: hypothetical protein ABSF25_23445 [Bryobacteraceae bacterium]|jgi:hypothetical protein
MASTQEDLLDDFATLASNLASNLNETSGTAQAPANSPGGATTDYSGLQIANTDPPAQPETIRAASNSSASGSSGGTSAAMLLLESGFGLAPLIGGLLGLFGGGGSPAPPELTKYAMPSALNIEAADTGQGLSNADYDQTGTPRAYDGTGSPSVETAASGSSGGQASSGGQTGPASGTSGNGASQPQITVSVQAMDARSFMDRSTDIAAAVRDAMLNLNSINDVVTDL